MQLLLKLQRFICYRFLRLFTLSFISFFLFSQLAWSATYYVDATNGNNSNNGTSELTPWKTIAKVNSSMFNPGDQILLKRGEVWRETLLVPSSGTPGKPIVFSAYGSGNKPTIVGSDVLTLWTNIGGNVWNATVATEPSVVWFNGTSGIKETAKANLNASTEWFWAGNVLSVYSATSPTNIEAASRKSSIIATGHSYLKFSNLKLINNGNVNSGAGIVLGSGSSEIEVDACDFSQADICHIGIWGTASGIFTISNSTFAYSGLGHYIGAGNAIDVTTTTTPLVIVEKSTFTHIGDWIGSGCHDHGIYFKSGRLIWRYNYVYNGGVETGAGVKISGDAQNGCEVYYNIFSKGSGTQVWGVLSEAGSGHLIYNNVFYGIGTAIWHLTGASGITIKNNILDDAGDSTEILKATVTTGWVSDYNVIHTSGRSSNLKWGASSYNFADWKTKSQQDLHSLAINPDFTEPTQGNFTLQPSSPCIDAGTDVGLRQDFNNVPVPQGSGVDIGALEYKKQSLLAPTNLQFVPPITY